MSINFLKRNSNTEMKGGRSEIPLCISLLLLQRRIFTRTPNIKFLWYFTIQIWVNSSCRGVWESNPPPKKLRVVEKIEDGCRIGNQWNLALNLFLKMVKWCGKNSKTQLLIIFIWRVDLELLVSVEIRKNVHNWESSIFKCMIWNVFSIILNSRRKWGFSNLSGGKLVTRELIMWTRC